MLKAFDGLDGFAEWSGLRERVIATIPICEDELRNSVERRSLSWSSKPTYQGMKSLVLEMKDDFFSSKTHSMNPAIFDLNETYFRQQLRAVHSDILSKYLSARVEEYKKMCMRKWQGRNRGKVSYRRILSSNMINISKMIA